MKKNSPKDPDATARDMLHLAQRQLARVLKELDATIDDLATRREDSPAKAKAISADVRKAIQTVFEERQRIDRLNEKNGGSGTGAGLDLDAARAEIGRRLARLRK